MSDQPHKGREGETQAYRPLDDPMNRTRVDDPIPLVSDTPKPRKSGATQKISLLGDFRLLSQLGAGGMGTVYRAWQISLSREVALKVLDKDMACRPGFLERFQREGRLLQRLAHPHIIRYFTVGEARGFHFLAMEYASGGNMQAWLDRLGRLDLGDALHVVLACARGLQYAHENHLVHRDIKPDNLLLMRDGMVKVADLGLARATDGDVTLTQTGVALGTPIYAAPEQLRDARRVDGRSDLYALGAVLYHLLAGEPPFVGADFLAIMQAKEQGTFTPIRRRRSEIPEIIDRILTRLLARIPEQRYQSCAELIEDLQWQQLDAPTLSFFSAKDR